MLEVALALGSAVAAVLLFVRSSSATRIAAAWLAAAYLGAGTASLALLPSLTGFHYAYDPCFVPQRPVPLGFALVEYVLRHVGAAFSLGWLLARFTCSRRCRVALALAVTVPFVPDAIHRWTMFPSLLHEPWDGVDLATAFLAGFSQDLVVAVVLVALVAIPRRWPLDARARGIHEGSARDVLADWRLPAALLAIVPALGVALASALLEGFGRVAVNSTGGTLSFLPDELREMRLPVVAGLVVTALLAAARFSASMTGRTADVTARGIAAVGAAVASACASVGLYAIVVAHWLDVHARPAAPPTSSSDFGFWESVDWRCVAVLALSLAVIGGATWVWLRSSRADGKGSPTTPVRDSAFVWLLAAVVLATAAALVHAQGPRPIATEAWPAEAGES